MAVQSPNEPSNPFNRIINKLGKNKTFSAESRQKKAIKKPNILIIKSLGFYLVGVAGFEPATSCSQSRRDDRATLHPEFYLYQLGN